MRNLCKEVDIINTRSFMVARVRVTCGCREGHLHEMPKHTNGKRGGVGDEEQPARGGIGDSGE